MGPLDTWTGVGLITVDVERHGMRLSLSLASCSSTPVRILSGFGDLTGPESYPRPDGPHRGVDIAGATGTAVIAPADGTVLLGRDEGDACGNIVMMQHRLGYKSVYCHLASYTVQFGNEVKRGDVIGYIGMTGWLSSEHLHWELRGLGAGGSVADDRWLL